MTGLPDTRASRGTGRAAALVVPLAAMLYLVVGCGPPASAPRGNAAPAARIVTLSPHLTELAFAAGAGSKLVGVVEFSNHPTEARSLPRVGDAFRLDLEALAAARPDLILGWPSGNPTAVLDRLRRLGYRVVEWSPGSWPTWATTSKSSAAWRHGSSGARGRGRLAERPRHAQVPPRRRPAGRVFTRSRHNRLSR